MLHNQKNRILLSAAYLPPLDYFAFLLNHRVVVETHETYAKQTYRNRCYIATEKGKMALSIPVSKPFGNRTKIEEVSILNEEKWFVQHWKALQTAYQSSPFFIYYQDDLKPFFRGDYNYLFDFNIKLTKKICELIGFEPTLSFTTHFEKVPKNQIDLRSDLSPKHPPILSDFPSYIQVFSDRHPFFPNLSIVDLLFNLGPEAKGYLLDLNDETTP